MLKWCLCPASFIWHCLLLIRVASRSFDRSACSWISQFIFLKILEFSGLHYCLFVKDQWFFVAVVLSGNSDILSWPLSFVNNFFKNFFVLKNFRFSRQVFILPYLPDICQQLFRNLFEFLFRCCVVSVLPWQRIWVYHPTYHLSTLFFEFFTQIIPCHANSACTGDFYHFSILFYEERKLLSELFDQVCQVIVFIQTCKDLAVSGVIDDDLSQGSQVSEDVKCIYCPNN